MFVKVIVTQSPSLARIDNGCNGSSRSPSDTFWLASCWRTACSADNEPWMSGTGTPVAASTV